MAFVSAAGVQGQVRWGGRLRCQLNRRSSFLGSGNGHIARAGSRSPNRRCLVVMDARKVLVPIGNGSEEIEATTIADTLVRAGAEVTIASVEDDLLCTMSRGIKIMADKKLDECKDEAFDLIALPGGMPGAERLRDSAVLVEMLKKQDSENKMIGAICAAPAVVLAHHGLLGSKKATCYPSPAFLEKLPTVVDDDEIPVVLDGNIMTSRGPGTALVFSLGLVERLFGDPKAEELASLMLLDLREDWSSDDVGAGPVPSAAGVDM